jgi:hypothetical protein
MNVTSPDDGVVEGVTDHCFRLTETLWVVSLEVVADTEGDDAVPEFGLALGFAFELEHDVPTTSAVNTSTTHVLGPFTCCSFPSAASGLTRLNRRRPLLDPVAIDVRGVARPTAARARTCAE